jgi:tetratricopeptide (TPR) repeat protein
LLAEGEFALVRQHLETGLPLPYGGQQAFGDHAMYTMLADVAALQRDEAAVLQNAPLAEEWATRYGHVLYLAIAARAWSVAHRLAGEYAEAEARLNRALEMFGALGTRWQKGRTLFELGELARARQRPAEARDYFGRALEDFDFMGARPDSARTRNVLGELRQAPGQS